MIATSTLINLERELIDEEIDNVLALYSDECSRKIAQVPGFRRKLTTYVLDNIELDIAGMKSQRSLQSKNKCPHRSLEFRLRIEKYITEGIAWILQINLDALERYIPRDDLVCPPFQWFN